MLGWVFIWNGENGFIFNFIFFIFMVVIFFGRFYIKMFVYGNVDFKVKGEN